MGGLSRTNKDGAIDFKYFNDKVPTFLESFYEKTDFLISIDTWFLCMNLMRGVIKNCSDYTLESIFHFNFVSFCTLKKGI